MSGNGESLDIAYNTCDDLTLKAHGIRLNPTVHQSNVIKSEDLLCLLDPVDDIADKLVVNLLFKMHIHKNFLFLDLLKNL